MKKTPFIICLIAAFTIFTLPVDAAISRTHEINFDERVPCVGEVVHLKGPFHVSLTFAGKSLTNVETSVQGIRGTGETTGRTYSASQINKTQSTNYAVHGGVGSGQVTVKFEVIGHREGNSGNLIRFWAKQTVRLHFAQKLTVDFESLDVCVTP